MALGQFNGAKLNMLDSILSFPGLKEDTIKDRLTLYILNDTDTLLQHGFNLKSYVESSEILNASICLDLSFVGY